jgi:hypothetical protein
MMRGGRPAERPCLGRVDPVTYLLAWVGSGDLEKGFGS